MRPKFEIYTHKRDDEHPPPPRALNDEAQNMLLMCLEGEIILKLLTKNIYSIIHHFPAHRKQNLAQCRKDLHLQLILVKLYDLSYRI